MVAGGRRPADWVGRSRYAGVTFDGPRLVDADLPARDGSFHGIDDVLTPTGSALDALGNE
jgi:hypothetical protein